ncbi:MAG: radical SAM protein [Candidatus Thermoplasmatota archaeon]|nr:radical SAM protein [Candidatus Thermoplasmatota archaeon]MBU4255951.1 radical SAM protein [Candidatus Thermoplasmatota archaeon]MCG2825514.1 radical SAM protein [Thermoplasmatales archaeon]
MKIVYGPVPSWRLGRSLGVDLICSENKTCSFDCVYCQLGKTKRKTVNRRVFVSIKRMEEELKSALEKVDFDVITFSGTGEPMLAKNLDKGIDAIKKYTSVPLAILTNSSLMNNNRVRKALNKLDIVVAKLDTPNRELFQKINNPAKEIKFDKIVQGIKRFREGFDGKLSLQMMFTDENREYAEEMARIARSLNPDEVQINTPLRPCPVKPLTRMEIENIEKHFNGLNVVSVYKKGKPEIKYYLNKNEVKKRRKNV